MGLSCGIVGLPNVGKSTLFNALTRAAVAAENFPFCTIEPNRGLVPVPDPRLAQIAALVQPQHTVPASVEFVDIAGLVRGASRGDGLGNQFLGHIRNCNAIAHLVRCFDDDDIVHSEGRVDPAADMDIIGTELALADMESLERAREKAARAAKGMSREAMAMLPLLERAHKHLDGGAMLRTMDLDHAERERLAPLGLLTSKPMLYVANTCDNARGSPHLDLVRERAAAEQAPLVVLCASMEYDLCALDADDRDELLAEMGFSDPGLARLVRAGYQLLGLHTYFTAGEAELRAWTVPVGADARTAAGTIHSDFARGFIRAEVVSYDDFITSGGLQAARKQGLWRLEGRDYIVQDGDIIHFRFNT